MTSHLQGELHRLQNQLIEVQKQERRQEKLIEHLQQQLTSCERKHDDLTPLDLSLSTLTTTTTTTRIERAERTANKCGTCKRVFPSPRTLKMHYRTHTGERPFPCQRGPRASATQRNLQAHLNIHRSANEYPIDAKNSFSPPADDDRQSSKTPSNSFLPPQIFPFLAAAWNSAKIDERSANTCQVCGKHFSSASALQIHHRTHTGERPFVCQICQRGFTTKGNLKVHMGTHLYQTRAKKPYSTVKHLA